MYVCSGRKYNTNERKSLRIEYKDFLYKILINTNE